MVPSLTTTVNFWPVLSGTCRRTSFGITTWNFEETVTWVMAAILSYFLLIHREYILLFRFRLEGAAQFRLGVHRVPVDPAQVLFQNYEAQILQQRFFLPVGELAQMFSESPVVDRPKLIHQHIGFFFQPRRPSG